MIIATTNSKGGVGKSTIAVHVALWLHEREYRIALIDSDFQHSSSQWMQEAAPNVPVFRMNDPDEIVAEASRFRKEYEHVILDGPAGTAEVTRALLLICDTAIIPCGPSLLDVRAAALAIRVLGSAKTVRGGKPDALFVCNKVQPHTRLSKDLLAFAEKIGIPVAKTPLHFRQVYADAVTQKTAVWHLGYRAREAAQEIHQLCEELFHVAH
jgi:chromosome partitioning protein